MACGLEGWWGPQDRRGPVSSSKLHCLRPPPQCPQPWRQCERALSEMAAAPAQAQGSVGPGWLRCGAPPPGQAAAPYEPHLPMKDVP